MGHERYAFFGNKMSVDLRYWRQHRERYSDSPSLFPTSRRTSLDVNNFDATVRRNGLSVGCLFILIYYETTLQYITSLKETEILQRE